MEQKVSYNGLTALLGLQNKPSDGILLVHGFGGTKDESHGLFKDLAEELFKVGFSTLRYDSKGIGESEGNFEEIDLCDWRDDFTNSLNYFKSQEEIKMIGVVGFSLGATISILNYDKIIKAMVLFAPALDPKQDMLNRYIKNNEYEKAKIGQSFKYGKKVGIQMYDSLNLNLTNKLQSVCCPVLIIHSDADQFIPFSTSERLIKEFRCKKELFVVNGTGHSFRIENDLSSRTQVYDKTLSWLKRYMT